ncbi:uncharacterized protein SPPG_00409 [Spizellomyces punctatus DAOM BR117]|uniref:Tail specific protease domain-containing protein n=1 Tax=Spizellomyces punctatus (strain DAOM BR117) TaxID=645134 RepID=A0A0L0HUB6_SPIPD|nr:uncharacterized protein SPPG_00409 [Spizellomyces punctatus DAOM BR117]KND04698.1 hypothetical protein SPPG_00409 [Spizellomyces punctatus DAOM BR117]|eukprot:XP_016612737.1 hypothetical protein SPPG_00409 [Spizellomyces punctatus DAOM BR117]
MIKAGIAALVGLAALSVDAAPTPGSDGCAQVAAQMKLTGGWIDHKNVKDCLDSFPLDQRIRTATVDTLRKAVDGQYSFTDMASIASTIDGGKWDLKDIDLLQSLDAFAKKNYQTDREFHDDLNNLFRDLGDAHTGYSSYCYHSAFTFRHPWTYRVLVGKDGKQIVQLGTLVAPNDAIWAAKIKEAIKVDPKELVGSTITAIDGKDPIAWVKAFGDSLIGLSKDSQTRFNQVTSRQGVAADGSITTRVGAASSRSRLPVPEATRKLALRSADGKNTTEIDVPWFAIAAPTLKANFTDSTSFYQNVCIRPQPTGAPTRRDVAAITHNDFINVAEQETVEYSAEQFAGLAVYPNKTDGSYGNGFPKTVKNGMYASFFLVDAETGVAAMPTYSSDGFPDSECIGKLKDPEATANIGTGGPAGACFYVFIMEVYDGIQQLKAQGAKRLILDWTDNGGGWGDLGYFAVATLFPNVKRDVATFRMTPLLKKLMTAAFEKDLNETTPLTMFGPSNFVDPATGLSLTSADLNRLILKTHKETFGKYTSEYSDFVSIVDGGGIADPKRPHNAWNATGIPPPVTPVFPVENVVVLTNGLCGSTCAHSARLIHDEVGVKVFVKGGEAGAKPFSFSSFPGGNVVDIPQLFDDLKRIGLENDALAPQPFLHSVSLWRVNAGVGYSKRKDLPAEYSYAAADCRIDITEETFFPPGAWKVAAELLKTGCGQAKPTPSGTPTTGPVGYPTGMPTGGPVPYPSGTPTDSPIGYPTSTPSGSPVEYPIGTPTGVPVGGAPGSYPIPTPKPKCTRKQ